MNQKSLPKTYHPSPIAHRLLHTYIHTYIHTLTLFLLFAVVTRINKLVLSGANVFIRATLLFLPIIFTLVSFNTGFLFTTPVLAQFEDCSNRIDDDDDGLVDCDDPDCLFDDDDDGFYAEPCGDDCNDSNPEIIGGLGIEICDDCVDNDCDGLVDCDDFDCDPDVEDCPPCTTTTTTTTSTTTTTETTTSTTTTTTTTTSTTTTSTTTTTRTTTSTTTTTTLPPPKICRTCPTAFSVRQGKTACKSFRVWNCGKGTLNWTVSEGCNWLTLSPSSGTSTGRRRTTVRACVNTAGIAKGNYECTVTITGGGASNTPQTCVIKLKVK